MDNLLKDRLLYDFYGALLTDHQQEILDLYFNEDLGLAEIAEYLNTSRQAVYDLVKRSNKTLNSYEKKLNLVDNEMNQERVRKKVINNLNSILTNEKMSNKSKELIKNCINDLKGGL